MSDLLAIDERLRAASLKAPNPVLLDRQIARVYETLLKWRTRQKDDPELADDPFVLHREIAGKKMWEAVGALDSFDPLKPHLQRWVYRFAEWRINRAVSNQLAVLDRVAKYPGPEAGQFTLHELLFKALRDPRSAAAWFTSYLAASREFSALTSKLWQRRVEIAQRFGLQPSDDSAAESAQIETAAQAWLERTNDLFSELCRETLAELTHLALDTDGRLGWPAHLSWRSLSEPFRKTALLTSFRLRSKRLPERIAPASFLRGLCRLGEEWSLALAPSDQPFVVANDPYRLQAHRDGALFASLAQNPHYLRAELGTGAPGLLNARRSVAISLLIESRARALKVILRSSAQKGERDFRETFVGEAERVFGVHVPPEAAGAVWRLGQEDPARFAGMLLAGDRGAELTAAHDEDWFRNPRAVDQLLSEGVLPPAVEIAEPRLALGADAVYRALVSAL